MVFDLIPEELRQGSDVSDVKEILWNFSRYMDKRRLTLKDNPHFYENLPTSADIYVGQFLTDPVETFQQKKISVLIDNLGPTDQVFLETAKERRAFGNVWVPKKAFIFKGSYLSVFLFRTP